MQKYNLGALYEVVPAQSYLEQAFLRWVLAASVKRKIVDHIKPQHEAEYDGHSYRIDYGIVGQKIRISIELDGFEFHGSRHAFSYGRLRQNDLHALGWVVVRFSYDSIRLETERCVQQLQAILAQDPLLGPLLIESP